MLTSSIVRIVDFCARRAWLVLLLSVLVIAVSGTYAVRHFSIDTNIDDLISRKIDWRQRQIAYNKAFPQLYQRIIVVIDGKTPELAQAAAAQLTQRLSTRKDVFQSVEAPDALPFFQHDGLLFEPLDTLRQHVQGLMRVQPLFGTLAIDPSLRGFAHVLAMSANGMQSNPAQAQEFTRLFVPVSRTLEEVLDGRKAFFSWQTLMSEGPVTTRETRRFIVIKPVFHYAELEPGKAATDAIRSTARALGLTQANGVTVRLTGDVALSDEQFGTLTEGAWTNNILTVLVVAFLLWAALRSPKIVLAILASVATGLAVTAALGLLMVGRFNLISMAFFVLFVGIGADFGIQFGVRYRAERHAAGDHLVSLRHAASRAGRPLALAAVATACGFLAFLPTVYRGVSELGLIAGVGMIVAFVSSITVLPAVLTLLGPPPEQAPVGYAFLAPVDSFLSTYRWYIIGGTLLIVTAASPLLGRLRFDFNPLHLQAQNTEAVETLKDLMKDPTTGYNDIGVVVPDVAAARTMVGRLSTLPEVSRVTWLGSFVPQDQDAKIAALANAAKAFTPSLSRQPLPPPTDADAMAALKQASAALQRAAGAVTGDSASAARRLAGDLDKLAQADEAKRTAAAAVFMKPLSVTLSNLKASLAPEAVTLQSLPADLRQSWETPDGHLRIDVAPKGDPNNNANLRRFTKAVTAVAPDAAGAPIAIQGAGDTIVRAFVEAGGWALLSISVLLLITLRRVTDVLLTLVPLLLAGVVTLEITVAIGLPLNFANIIALPLLLGLGVAFKIYFVMAWRAGVTNLLQSSLTRAVFFSAMTTATAFGSLWLSKDPGTSSMGKLLALSLVCTLAAAVLFQPALMGPPRQKQGEEVT